MARKVLFNKNDDPDNRVGIIWPGYRELMEWDDNIVKVVLYDNGFIGVISLRDNNIISTTYYPPGDIVISTLRRRTSHDDPRSTIAFE